MPKVPRSYPICILCRERPADSWEHILPKSVGGKLQIRLLCTPCNNGIGARMVATLPKDPAVRFIAEKLRGKIEDLAGSILNGTVYSGLGPGGGVIRMQWKDGKHQV